MLGLLDACGPGVHLVHSVWVDNGELDLIAQHGAVVVHCAVSNMYLASGITPIRQMLDRDIPVALGTDGPGAQSSRDLLETLKVTALLARVSSSDVKAVNPSVPAQISVHSGVFAARLSITAPRRHEK